MITQGPGTAGHVSSDRRIINGLKQFRGIGRLVVEQCFWGQGCRAVRDSDVGNIWRAVRAALRRRRLRNDRKASRHRATPIPCCPAILAGRHWRRHPGESRGTLMTWAERLESGRSQGAVSGAASDHRAGASRASAPVRAAAADRTIVADRAGASDRATAAGARRANAERAGADRRDRQSVG